MQIDIVNSKYNIDAVVLQETNTKWNIVSISRMRRHMKRIDRGV